MKVIKKVAFLIIIVVVTFSLAAGLLFTFSTSKPLLDKRITNALQSTNLKPVKGPKYSSYYYKGPLIDSHYHIPNLPESLGEDDDGITPVLGQNLKISDIVFGLEKEKTRKVFAFFPVYPESSKLQIELVKQTMKRYPNTFVPFIMPPDADDSKNGSPTAEAKVLKRMLDVYPGLFKGYGEIGLYERKDGARELPPDSKRLRDIYPLIRKYNLLVYFHLGVGHKESFERALKENRGINFIFHGDQLVSYEGGKQDPTLIEALISKNPNVYYTVDELYGDKWMIKPEVTKKEFLKYLQNYELLLKKDLATWRGIIERHPDQFMWGTDRSDQVLWSHDAKVGQALANYGRAFIARLDPAVQAKFAYKNAEKLLQKQEKVD